MEEKQPEMLGGFSTLLCQSVHLGNTCCLLQAVHVPVSFYAICRDAALCPKVCGTPGELHVPPYKHKRWDLSRQLLSALPFNSVEAGSSRHLTGSI